MKRASWKISQWVRKFIKEDFAGEVTILNFGTPPHYHITGVGVGRYWLEMMADKDEELKRILVEDSL